MMTTNNFESSPSEPSEEPTMLEFLRKECGQEYTDEDRRLEVFIKETVALIKVYEQLLEVIDRSERAKYRYMTSSSTQDIVSTDLS